VTNQNFGTGRDGDMKKREKTKRIKGPDESRQECGFHVKGGTATRRINRLKKEKWTWGREKKLTGRVVAIARKKGEAGLWGRGTKF